MAFLPYMLLRRIADCRNFRHDFKFQRDKRVEVSGVQLVRAIKTGRVIHAAFAAPAVDMLFDIPFKQTKTVAVAVVYIPLQISFKFRVNLSQPVRAAVCFVDQPDAKGYNRGLSNIGYAVRRHHMSDKTVFALHIQDRVNRFAGHPVINMADADRVKNRIPQPHPSMRPAVGGCPVLFDQTFRRAYLCF